MRVSKAVALMSEGPAMQGNQQGSSGHNGAPYGHGGGQYPSGSFYQPAHNTQNNIDHISAMAARMQYAAQVFFP